MTEYGLLINYEYCTGCHTCEVACKLNKKLPLDAWGIKVLQDGPRQNPDGSWEYTYMPVPTSLCDLCAGRVSEGRLPTCVHHCQAGCMYYDTVEELAKLAIDKPRSVIYRLAVDGAEPFINKDPEAIRRNKEKAAEREVEYVENGEYGLKEDTEVSGGKGIIPQEEVNKAWNRAGGCCECEAEGHGHDGEKCGHRCIYSMQGGANEAGWEAMVVDPDGPLTAENCIIVCRSCVNKLV
ncbi:MAG: hypothetical protein ACOYIK_03025 [Coriobacteriales bacterium]|jgi:Fe-S-cluster-containing dehydrogenase component